MRLKFLFFPIVLIISISIFFGYIWPEISNVKSINEEKTTNEKTLASIKSEQEAIKTVGQQLASDSNGQALVKTYLPENKIEEQIIGGVNYLASNTNVSLVNITLQDATNSDNNTSTTNTAAAIGQNVNMMKTGEVAPVAPAGSQAPINNDQMQFTEASISLSGDYSKLKIFLDGLEHMSLLNTIKSLTISAPGENKDSNSKDAANIDPNALSMNLIVDFGYFKTSTINSQQVTKFKPALDTDTLDTLKQYVSAHSLSAGLNEDVNKGKANPFLP